VDVELRQLIREGIDQGISVEKLAEASGLSTSRVYQIRDGRRK
jgi:transcriptional regulator with XRE-family HTH domain